MSNIFAGWLWVLMWESISSEGAQDTSFISILVLIYQSSVTERRHKAWPLLALALVLLSGVISVVSGIDFRRNKKYIAMNFKQLLGFCNDTTSLTVEKLPNLVA